MTDTRTRSGLPGFRFIGKPVVRKEDERLTTGRGRFSDDFSLAGEVHAVMVRSPHPHARILGVDAVRAAAMPASSASSPVPTAPPTASGRSRTIRCPRPGTT